MRFGKTANMLSICWPINTHQYKQYLGKVDNTSLTVWPMPVTISISMNVVGMVAPIWRGTCPAVCCTKDDGREVTVFKKNANVILVMVKDSTYWSQRHISAFKWETQPFETSQWLHKRIGMMWKQIKQKAGWSFYKNQYENSFSHNE